MVDIVKKHEDKVESVDIVLPAPGENNTQPPKGKLPTHFLLVRLRSKINNYSSNDRTMKNYY